ncbi:MAG: hypothetical protein ACLQUY_29455 [Ktedonobacterales bacterium]
MLSDTYSDSQSKAAPSIPRERPTAADPWDMPYFGGPAYFHYQPSLHRDEASSLLTGANTPVSQPTTVASASNYSVDPWDAPYFGGPVYFDYRANPAALASPPPSLGSSSSAAREDARPLAGVAAATPSRAIQPDGAASRTVRRNWLARLFGQR